MHLWVVLVPAPVRDRHGGRWAGNGCGWVKIGADGCGWVEMGAVQLKTGLVENGGG